MKKDNANTGLFEIKLMKYGNLAVVRKVIYEDVLTLQH